MNRLTAGAPPANTLAMDDAAPAPKAMLPEATLPEATLVDAAPFRLERPGAVATPVICASPHSGRIYPLAMMAASQLDRRAIRRSEDAHVDELIAQEAGFG